MKTVRDTLSICMALLAALLLCGAVGVVGVDLAENHRNALQNREKVPVAKVELSMHRTLASRYLPDDELSSDDGKKRAFPNTVWPAQAGLSMLLASLLLAARWVNQQRELQRNATNLQYRFIHSR